MLKSWRFWVYIAGLIVASMFIGAMISASYVSSRANNAINEQKKAYDEASESRRVVLTQCLTDNRRMADQLAGLTGKSIDATKSATEALRGTKQ